MFIFKFRLWFAVIAVGALVSLLAACGGTTSGPTSSSSAPATTPTESSQGEQEAGGASIVGTWTGDCSLGHTTSFKLAEFRADGTVVLDNYVAKYTVPSGSQLQLSTPYATVEVNYALLSSGDILALADSSGNFCSVGRDGSNAVQEAAQLLIGTWAGTCPDVNIGGTAVVIDKLEFRSDGSMAFNGGSYEPYTVPDAGHVVFLNEVWGNGSMTWPFLVSGTTLSLIAQGSGGANRCSLQKSA